MPAIATVYEELDAAVLDGITRLGVGAPRNEVTAVQDAITSLYRAQGLVTDRQCAAIVEAAFKSSERRVRETARR
jgi:hypothetical protein